MIWAAQQATAWISPSRLAPFLALCDGEHDQACELYAWHANLSGACHAHIHHVEVLLRNTIDRSVATATGSDEWLLDSAILTSDGLKEVRKAKRRLETRSDGNPRVHGDLVAALQFGFWRAMFQKPYEGLWRAGLHNGFPSRGPGQERKELGNRLEAIRKFRNRVAHHDSLLSVDVEGRLREMDTLCRAIDPSAVDWITAHSTVREWLATRPS